VLLRVAANAVNNGLGAPGAIVAMEIGSARGMKRARSMQKTSRGVAARLEHKAGRGERGFCDVMVKGWL
jgi:hypothetical protein